MVSAEAVTELSIFEVPQQFLAGESIAEDVEHKLGRACTAHALAIAQELANPELTTTVPELIDFVLEHGAQTGSELYTDGIGWNLIRMADLLRMRGFSVTSQDLRYGPDVFDIRAATQSGRVRSEQERIKLTLASTYGGADRSRWITAIQETLEQGGSVVTSLQIPLLAGGFGPHAVVIKAVDPDTGFVDYYDPDAHNIRRYQNNPPQIERIHESQLLFRRPIADHVSIMTGEILHIRAR